MSGFYSPIGLAMKASITRTILNSRPGEPVPRTLSYVSLLFFSATLLKKQITQNNLQTADDSPHELVLVVPLPWQEIMDKL